MKDNIKPLFFNIKALNLLKKTGLIILATLFCSPLFAEGWHFGEFKKLNLAPAFSGFLYVDVDGVPVYYQGGNLRVDIYVENTGNRTFNNFRIRCVYYRPDGTLLSDDAVSPWKEASMGPGENTTLTFWDTVPSDIHDCDGYLELEVQHKNESGEDEPAAFKIYSTPIRFF